MQGKGKNATTSIPANAGPSVEHGSSVDSADACNLTLAIEQFHLLLTVLQAAPPQKKARDAGTTPTPTPIPTPIPRTETTTEDREDIMDASDEPTPQVVKNSETTRHSKSSRPDPYTTLPAKTTSYIQLRFQLMNFKNVIASFNSRPRSPSPIYTHSSSTCSAGATRTCIAQRLFRMSSCMTRTATWLAL